MIVKLKSTGLPELYPPMKRSEGVHVSDKIKRICLDRGIYDEQTVLDHTRMRLGQAFEWAIIQSLARNYPHRYIVPGEIVHDNIYGNPDLLDIEDEALEEIKWTFRSSGQNEESPDYCEVGHIALPQHSIHSIKFWKDWCQLKCYCHMMGLTKGRLVLCHVRGNYKGFEIHHNVWEADFTKQELLENWLLIKNY